MKDCSGRRFAICLLATLTLISCRIPTSPAEDVWVAIGQSGFGKDPVAMGRAAGAKAKAACNGRKPDLVLYSDHGWATKTDEDKKALLDGVAESFDRKQIYGFTSHGVFSQDVAKGGALSDSGFVGVLVLGGVRTTCVKAAVPEKGKAGAAYATLAESLKAPYAAAAGKGRLILVLGGLCSTEDTGQRIVDAFTHTLGKDVQIFGGESPCVPGYAANSFNWRAQFFQGELLRETVVAILITGDFTCSFGMAVTSPQITDTQEPELVIQSAKKATDVALGDKTNDVIVMFVASSYHRAHSLMKGKQSKGEIAVLEQALRAPIFGFSDDGEIGHPATGEPPVGAMNHISVCVIRKAGSAGK